MIKEQLVKYMKSLDFNSDEMRNLECRYVKTNGFLLPNGDFLNTGFAMHAFFAQKAYESIGISGGNETRFCNDLDCIVVSSSTGVLNFKIFDSMTEEQFEKICILVIKHSDEGYMLTCKSSKMRNYKHCITKHTGIKCLSTSIIL